MAVQQTSGTKKAQHYVPGHHERLEEELCLFGALQEGLVVFFAETVDLYQPSAISDKQEFHTV